MGILKQSTKNQVKGYQKLIANRIHVAPERHDELQQLNRKAREEDAIKTHPTRTVLCINLSQGVVHELVKLCQGDASKMRLMFDRLVDKKSEGYDHIFKAEWLEENTVDAIVLELTFDECNELNIAEKKVYALAMVFRVPVIGVTRSLYEDQRERLEAFTGGTWPVHEADGTSQGGDRVYQWLEQELPLIRKLRQAVDEDVTSKIEYMNTVNKTRHFMSRAAVSWVPGGMLVLNLYSSMKRVSKMMRITGMTPVDDESDKPSKGLLQKLGLMASAKSAMVETLGDVYQYAVYIWLAVAAADGAMNLAASVLDEVLAGSVVVVAAALSTAAEVHTRPTFVRKAGEFLAMLQLIYLINPKMRRLQLQEQGLAPSPSSAPLVSVQSAPLPELYRA